MAAFPCLRSCGRQTTLYFKLHHDVRTHTSSLPRTIVKEKREVSKPTPRIWILDLLDIYLVKIVVVCIMLANNLEHVFMFISLLCYAKTSPFQFKPWSALLLPCCVVFKNHLLFWQQSIVDLQRCPSNTLVTRLLFFEEINIALSSGGRR